MLRRFAVSVMLAFLTLLVVGGVALAAWEYMFPIIIVDTSNTTRAYYPVMLGFGGQTLVDAAKISSSGTDTSMQIGSTSINYMMSTTNVTAVIPSLPSGGVVTVNLYTGYTPEQSGFPIITGSGGNVTVTDNGSLEGGDNFTYEVAGWVDTSQGSSTAGWISPDGHIDYSGTWASETNAYDDNVTSAATADSLADTYTDWLGLSTSNLSINVVRAYNPDVTSGMEVDIFYDGGFHNIYSADPPFGWETIDISPPRVVSVARIRVKRPTADTKSFYEFQFGDFLPSHPLIYKKDAFSLYVSGAGNVTATVWGLGDTVASITATGVSSEGHTVSVKNRSRVARESFYTGDDDTYTHAGAAWRAETFIALSSKPIGAVKVKVNRTGVPGTGVVSIRATSGGLPVGDDLASGAFNANGWTATPGSGDQTLEFSSTFEPVVGASYALVLRLDGGDAANKIGWRVDTANGYASGHRCLSADSGETWSESVTVDYLFTLYTQPFGLYIDGEIAASSNVSVSIPDNSANWTLFANDVCPYADYAKIYDNDETLYKTVTNNAYFNSHGDLTTVANGNLLMAYRRGTAHYGVNASVITRISSDGGHSWGAESVVASFVAPQTLDGVSVSAADNGTAWITCWIQSGGNPTVDGIYIIQSNDNGATWGAPDQITECGFNWYAGGDARVVEMDDGTLLLPYFGKDAADTFTSVRRLKSTDGGGTWGGEVTVANGETDGMKYDHTSLVNLGGSNLFGLIRTFTASMYGVWSYDSGTTWTTPIPVFLSSPTATRVSKLSDGRLVSVHRASDSLYIAAYRVSSNSGVTWGSETEIDGDQLYCEAGGAAEFSLGGSSHIGIAYFTEMPNSETYTPTLSTLCQARFVSYDTAFNNTTDLEAWYQPNAMISGSTLPDREGSAQDGTIHWGSNSGISLSYGEMLSYENYTAAVSAVGGFDMPEASMPETWFAAGENVANLPFYDSFSSVAAQTGQPVQSLYALAIIGVGFGVFLGITMFVRSALLGYIAMVGVFGIGASMTVIPAWIVFALVVVGAGTMYLYRQVAY